ncbi:MAG: MerR family DNA-binding protein, partial [Lysobacteraceae bacterium]
EAQGLIPPAQRTFAGYRLYADADLHRLRFIRRARRLGFSMQQVGVLLGLWNDRRRASAEVKALAQQHARELGARIDELQAMQRTLLALARDCHGDQRPECPILDDLAGGARAPGQPQPPLPQPQPEDAAAATSATASSGASTVKSITTAPASRWR